MTKINDIEFHNQFVKDVTLNKELEDEILKSIPDEYNKLQKIYYIYRMLCHILTYDTNNFLYEDDSIHDNIKYISTVNKDNNKVVCYDASLIFAKFLEILDIEFTIYNGKDYNDAIVSTRYGNNRHQFVLTKVDNFLISADIATGLQESDLIKEKFDGGVKNFKLVDSTLEEEIEFYKQIVPVDKYINSNYDNLYDKIFYNNVNLFITRPSITLSNEEKEELFIDVINQNNIGYLEMVNIIWFYINGIFNSNKNNECDILAYNDNGEYKDVLLIAISYKDKEIDNYKYYLMIDNKINKTSKEYIDKCFENNILIRLNKLGHKNIIPGIEGYSKRRGL